jgi:hypothetical protein
MFKANVAVRTELPRYVGYVEIAEATGLEASDTAPDGAWQVPKAGRDSDRREPVAAVRDRGRGVAWLNLPTGSVVVAVPPSAIEQAAQDASAADERHIPDQAIVTPQPETNDS